MYEAPACSTSLDVELTGELGAVGHTELAARAIEVAFDRADGDLEAVGDRPIGQALGGERDELPFTIGDPHV